MNAFALTREQQDFAERVRDLASGQLRALAEAGTPGHVNRELGSGSTRDVRTDFRHVGTARTRS